MIQRLNDVLTNQENNYILPFFWQHGEDEATLREYMGAIQDCGIGAVCVECRPHPDFCGERWWHDMDIILDEARKRKMKVWILDDAHFPTGQANGTMADAPAALCKQYLFYTVCDIAGPTPDAELDVYKLAHRIRSPFSSPKTSRRGPVREFDDDRFLAVVAARAAGSGIDASTLVDLTDGVGADGRLFWDVPEGYWRIFVLYLTRNGMGASNYINMVSIPSCAQQIKSVYEPHWQHYADDFGTTIAGFFSDEPELGNTSGGFENWIGTQVPISWSDEVDAALRARLGKDFPLLLPAIWYSSPSDGASSRVRYLYMDVITRLVERDFSMQIGNWCQEHGVKYIGHSIEDNNQHARMGQSLGHQFRGLAGQHMGGIDDIGNQVKLAGAHDLRCGSFTFGSATPEQDGEFYHFVLGKLGSSHGHLDPRKQGDSMCEVFGAYGWSEGTRLEKYLTDHFLVRGINHFVPHAFSPKRFPDPDCPPHFYAHGYNPLYRPFGMLMRYMNRMCHLFSGGTHVAPVGLLYHAEAEWAGREEGYMLMQKPARVLSEHQIDFDILWSDLFAKTERFRVSFDGKVLAVGSERFRAVVVPYTKYITAAFAAFAVQAAEHHFPIIFIDALPEGICGQSDSTATSALIRSLARCRTCTLRELPAFLHSLGATDIHVSRPFEDLRYLRYCQEQELYMFFNESSGKAFSGFVSLPVQGEPILYDAMHNRLLPAHSSQSGSGTQLELHLEPCESIVVAFDTGLRPEPARTNCSKRTILEGPWSLLFSAAGKPAFGADSDAQVLGKQALLPNLARLRPDFSGTVRYTCTFSLMHSTAAILEIENAYEAIEVHVNGRLIGMEICPPYRIDLTGFVHPGENMLCIDVFTTLQRYVETIPPDPAERAPIPEIGPRQPYGLVGHVWLLTENES